MSPVNNPTIPKPAADELSLFICYTPPSECWHTTEPMGVSGGAV